MEFWESDLIRLRQRLLATLREDPELLNPDGERTFTTLSSLLVELNMTWRNVLNDENLNSSYVSHKAAIAADFEV